MTITFPADFMFGTSTSAYQIETAFEHDWLNVRSRDGNIFNRTTDHEKRSREDVEIIASLAPHYRTSLMWSKLQRGPYALFDRDAVRHYSEFLEALTEKGIKIMMVMHHFANPMWFAKAGGWANEQNIHAWLDYGQQLIETFDEYVTIWNTFNEPNLYTAMAYVKGEFPPFEKDLLKANRVIQNMSEAHCLMFDALKRRQPEKLVGISHNCTLFEAENLLGVIPAKLYDWCYMNYAERLFKKTDFFGMSYYARIGFDPFPITKLMSPEKLRNSGKAADDMWEYYPQGLEECIMRFWKKYKKPVIVTENGICTRDDNKRIAAIKDYMKAISSALSQGANVTGYYHWSTWDNFEWSLGPTFNFGLYSCNATTTERQKKASAAVYASLAYSKKIEVSDSGD